MSRTKIIILALALLVIVIGVILALSYTPKPQQRTTTPIGFPSASSTTGGTGGQTGGGQQSGGVSGGESGSTTPATVIATQSGPLTVNDFLHNGITQPDVQNPGNYYLAGSAGYCTQAGVCPQGATTTNFKITFDSNQQFFTIALTDEPIGAARLAAEQFLASTLGISPAQMCALKYYLGTDIYTNSFYGGKNLGFSFCPGATALPQ
jgi:hypothetical protein